VAWFHDNHPHMAIGSSMSQSAISTMIEMIIGKNEIALMAAAPEQNNWLEPVTKQPTAAFVVAGTIPAPCVVEIAGEAVVPRFVVPGATVVGDTVVGTAAVVGTPVLVVPVDVLVLVVPVELVLVVPVDVLVLVVPVLEVAVLVVPVLVVPVLVVPRFVVAGSAFVVGVAVVGETAVV